MTDTTAFETETAPNIRVLAQYVRDLSFENPRAPASLTGDGTPPKIDLEVELNASRSEDGQYQLEMTLKVGATRDDLPVFHVELVYGGVFLIEAPEEALEQIVL